MSGIRSYFASRLRKALLARGLGVVRIAESDRRNLGSAYQVDTPAPADADETLRPDHPDLVDLRARYQSATPAAGRGRRWSVDTVARHVNLRYFRGDGPYIWHYRELPETTRLKYYIRLQDVRARDTLGLLERLNEDGAFGCWTFDFPGQPTISRDLLDSIGELYFLERHLKALSTSGLRILDLGAGCGRMAYRYLTAQPAAGDYFCVDAIPESTFLCRYYLEYRGILPRTRIVPLDRVDSELTPGAFDIAFNIHSFSECPRETVAWWLERLKTLEVPYLFIVPNDGPRLLSLEASGERRNFADLVAAAGFREVAREPVIEDPASRQLLGIDDYYLLFKRDG